MWSSSTSRGEAVCDAKTVASFSWPEAWGGVALALARRLGVLPRADESRLWPADRAGEETEWTDVNFPASASANLAWASFNCASKDGTRRNAKPSWRTGWICFSKTTTETTTGEMKSTGASCFDGTGAVGALVRCKCSAMESISKLASRIVRRSWLTKTLSATERVETRPTNRPALKVRRLNASTPYCKSWYMGKWRGSCPWIPRFRLHADGWIDLYNGYPCSTVST